MSNLDDASIANISLISVNPIHQILRAVFLRSFPLNFCSVSVVEEVLGLAGVHREQGVVKLR